MISYKVSEKYEFIYFKKNLLQSLVVLMFYKFDFWHSIL